MRHTVSCAFLVLEALLLASCKKERPNEIHSGDELPAPSSPWEDQERAALAPVSLFTDIDFSLEAMPPRRCEVNDALSPQRTFVRVSVPLLLLGKSKRSVPVSALSFTLEDQEGHRYRPTLAGCAPTIAHQELKDTGRIKGEVAFDIPDPELTLDLLFRPFIIGRKEIAARVRVPPLDARREKTTEAERPQP